MNDYANDIEEKLIIEGILENNQIYFIDLTLFFTATLSMNETIKNRFFDA